MPELLARGREDLHGGVVQDESSPARFTTYCPVLLAFDATRSPQRSSATYALAIGLHLFALMAFVVRVHQAVHPVAANLAVHAMTIMAPAAPPSPVEEKVAPKPSPQLQSQQRKIMRAVTDTPPVPQAINAPPMFQTASPFPSLLTMPATRVTVAGPVGRPNASGQDRKSSTAQNASEAAAPPSSPAPDGALAGAKATWEGEILARLGKFRRYPAVSRLRHEEGIVYVRFRLDRAGHVLSCAMDHSSGFSALDKEAVATVSRAQPLPAIPSNMPDVVELSLPIEFFFR